MQMPAGRRKENGQSALPKVSPQVATGGTTKPHKHAQMQPTSAVEVVTHRAGDHNVRRQKCEQYCRGKGTEVTRLSIGRATSDEEREKKKR